MNRSTSNCSRPDGRCGASRYTAKVPTGIPSRPWIGVDQQLRKPADSAWARYSTHRGSVRTSAVTTAVLSAAAVPQEPAWSPMASPSMAAT